MRKEHLTQYVEVLARLARLTPNVYNKEPARFAPATTMRYVNSRYLGPLLGSPKDLTGHIVHPLEVVSTLHSSSEPWTRI